MIETAAADAALTSTAMALGSMKGAYNISYTVILIDIQHRNSRWHRFYFTNAKFHFGCWFSLSLYIPPHERLHVVFIVNIDSGVIIIVRSRR